MVYSMDISLHITEVDLLVFSQHENLAQEVKNMIKLFKQHRELKIITPVDLAMVS